MTPSNGNIVRVTGSLCKEFTGPWWIPRTKTSDAELWCFRCVAGSGGDLRRHRARYDAIVIYCFASTLAVRVWMFTAKMVRYFQQGYILTISLSLAPTYVRINAFLVLKNNCPRKGAISFKDYVNDPRYAIDLVDMNISFLVIWICYKFQAQHISFYKRHSVLDTLSH